MCDYWTGSTWILTAWSNIGDQVEPGPQSQISIDITGGNHEKGQGMIRQVPSQLTNHLVDIQNSTLSFTGLKRDRDTDDLLFTWYSQCWRLG